MPRSSIAAAASGGPAARPGSVAHRANLPAIWRRRSAPPLARATEEPASASNTNRLGRLEAVLWLADGPLPLRRLARAAGLAGVGEARELLDTLRRRSSRRRSALEVVEVAGGVRLLTRPAFAPWLAKLDPEAGDPAHDEPRLSGPALETLAIVAYRQPVVRAEVEAIRGVGCGELLRQLLETDLLRIVGRSGELGKPLLYGTTGRFLELFGLRNLEGLPRAVEGSEGAGPTKQNAPLEHAAAGSSPVA